MKIKRVNIGEIIKNKVAEKGMSEAAFAKSINIQRQNIKKTVFSKNSIDTDLLISISESLEFDFFQYYRNSDSCNIKDYNEVKGVLSIEFGKEKKDQVFRFVFGENNLEISNK
jgi:transcriptional regulator with XRE-family HTH domain